MIIDDPLASRWILPEGVDELLPEAAADLEALRQQLLVIYSSWGYDLVFPPLVEYVESLTTGTGQDLAVQTFQVTDHISGRRIGFRADITPQVARMDAHRLSDRPINRLCYCGSVLRARPSHLADKRTQVHTGVELFGHSGVASDIEILQVMLQSLNHVQCESVVLDLGHVGVLEAVLQWLNLREGARRAFLDILSRKSEPDLRLFLQQESLSSEHQQVCHLLLELHGPRPVLDRALQVLVKKVPQAAEPLTTLIQIADTLGTIDPSLQLYFDLGEMRGFDYHTGLIFTAYGAGQGASLASGGRYDAIGQAFGQARPAVGFSMDLLRLVELGTVEKMTVPGIYAPYDLLDSELRDMVKQLRLAGERVVNALPDLPVDPHLLGCNRKLVKRDKVWRIEMLKETGSC